MDTIDDNYYFEVIRFPPILWTIFSPVFAFVCIWYQNESNVYLIILGVIYVVYTFLGVFFDCNVEMYNYNVKMKPYELMGSIEKAMIGSKIVMKSHTKDIENQDENVFKAMIYTGNSLIIKSILWLTYFLGVTSQIFMWNGNIIVPKLELMDKTKKQQQKDKLLMENAEKKKHDAKQKQEELEQKRKHDEKVKIIQRKSMIMLTTKIATIVSAKMITLNATSTQAIQSLSNMEFDVNLTDIKDHEIQDDHFMINMPNVFEKIGCDSYDPDFDAFVDNFCDGTSNDQITKNGQIVELLDNFISALLFVPKKLVGV